MTRTNIHFSKEQLNRLRQARDHWGIPIAEIVRRAVDDYLHRTLLWPIGGDRK